ncbi:MAG: hypothetical protein R3C03_18500 [Pirellulaceae bacterium]
MRINPLTGIVVAFILVWVSTRQAIAEVRHGDEVVIGKDEVIDDDLYVFAQKVTVLGTIKGDLTVFCQDLNISGTIEGDLIAGAQLISVTGLLFSVHPLERLS